MLSAQDDPGPALSHDMHSANFSGVPQPFMGRQSWMLSELTPTFEDAGYTYGLGAQLGPRLQTSNDEGAELFYGLDTPFWVNNDQWREIGGNN
jgi:hypothetical protein